MCQHVLLIARKTTKYTVIITKEQEKMFRFFFFFEGVVFIDFLNFVQKSPVGRKGCVSRYYYTIS